MPTTHTFESFFEDEKDRLLRVLSVITGSRGHRPGGVHPDLRTLGLRRDDGGSERLPVPDGDGRFRSAYRLVARTLKGAVGLDPTEDVFIAVEDRELAAQALARLTPRQRAALVLTAALGYSGEETGAALGIKAC